MLIFLLWEFNERPRRVDRLQNGCFSKTKQLRKAKSFGSLMNFEQIIQVFVFEPLNRLISEVYYP